MNCSYLKRLFLLVLSMFRLLFVWFHSVLRLCFKQNKRNRSTLLFLHGYHNKFTANESIHSHLTSVWCFPAIWIVQFVHFVCVLFLTFCFCFSNTNSIIENLTEEFSVSVPHRLWLVDEILFLKTSATTTRKVSAKQSLKSVSVKDDFSVSGVYLVLDLEN